MNQIIKADPQAPEQPSGANGTVKRRGLLSGTALSLVALLAAAKMPTFAAGISSVNVQATARDAYVYAYSLVCL